MKVFIDERPLVVSPGVSVRQAVHAFDAALGAALDAGAAHATDGVGRELDPVSIVAEGAIIRVIKSARRPEQRR